MLIKYFHELTIYLDINRINCLIEIVILRTNLIVL